ncbi:hypothetical protein EBR25_10130 [bacterium]|nr:hypothetical protein [bacterium]
MSRPPRDKVANVLEQDNRRNQDADLSEADLSTPTREEFSEIDSLSPTPEVLQDAQKNNAQKSAVLEHLNQPELSSQTSEHLEIRISQTDIKPPIQSAPIETSAKEESASQKTTLRSNITNTFSALRALIPDSVEEFIRDVDRALSESPLVGVLWNTMKEVARETFETVCDFFDDLFFQPSEEPVKKVEPTSVSLGKTPSHLIQEQEKYEATSSQKKTESTETVGTSDQHEELFQDTLTKRREEEDLLHDLKMQLALQMFLQEPEESASEQKGEAPQPLTGVLDPSNKGITGKDTERNGSRFQEDYSRLEAIKRALEENA